MAMDRKQRVSQKIAYLDRVSFSATASTTFKTIDTTINGDGSEIYDYEFMIRADGLANIRMVLNSLTSYSQDYMQGSSSTPSADTTIVTAIPIIDCNSSTYTSMCKVKITGYIGNKRHIEVFNCGQDGATFVRIASYYTTDTSSEITSISFFDTATRTVTLTCVGTAVPKIQYNPNAPLLKNLDLTNQTADIILGGANDTVGLGDLDGENYDYYILSFNITGQAKVHLNGNKTANKTRQRMQNNTGVISSANNTINTQDALIRDGECFISAEVGRKPIITCISNKQSAQQQIDDHTTNPDTATPLTTITISPDSTISGNVQLYAIQKGLNADLTPWTHRQTIPVDNLSFASGYSFDIKSDALFARIQIKGYSASGSNIELDFDTTTSISKQYLKSLSSATTALFATNRTIGKIQSVSDIDCIVALKSGANRPILSKSNYNENTIDLNGLWALDSTSVYSQLILNADNTNLMDAEISVSFY